MQNPFGKGLLLGIKNGFVLKIPDDKINGWSSAKVEF